MPATFQKSLLPRIHLKRSSRPGYGNCDSLEVRTEEVRHKIREQALTSLRAGYGGDYQKSFGSLAQLKTRDLVGEGFPGR